MGALRLCCKKGCILLGIQESLAVKGAVGRDYTYVHNERTKCADTTVYQGQVQDAVHPGHQPLTTGRQCLILWHLPLSNRSSASSNFLKWSLWMGETSALPRSAGVLQFCSAMFGETGVVFVVKRESGGANYTVILDGADKITSWHWHNFANYQINGYCKNWLIHWLHVMTHTHKKLVKCIWYMLFIIVSFAEMVQSLPETRF